MGSAQDALVQPAQLPRAVCHSRPAPGWCWGGWPGRGSDPVRLGIFWAGVLGWDLVDDADDGIVLLPSDDTGFQVDFFRTTASKIGPNQMHFDLTSTSLEDQKRTVANALKLGGSHLDIGQGAEATHVVLADPEGNEFCVIEPGNKNA